MEITDDRYRVVKSWCKNPDWRKGIKTESIHNPVMEFWYKMEQSNRTGNGRGCQIKRVVSFLR